MAKWTISQTVDLLSGVSEVEYRAGVLYYVGDKNAHVWRVRVLEGGKPLALNGTVMGSFVRADRTMVPLSGTIKGDTAEITLTSACSAVAGDLTCLMELETGESIIPLAAMILPVRQGKSDRVADPEHIIPSIREVQDAVAGCKNAAKDANDAANRANTAAEKAKSATDRATGATNRADTAAAEAERAAASWTESNAAKLGGQPASFYAKRALYPPKGAPEAKVTIKEPSLVNDVSITLLKKAGIAYVSGYLNVLGDVRSTIIMLFPKGFFPRNSVRFYFYRTGNQPQIYRGALSGKGEFVVTGDGLSAGYWDVLFSYPVADGEE